jgi:hypothetical protein
LDDDLEMPIEGGILFKGTKERSWRVFTATVRSSCRPASTRIQAARQDHSAGAGEAHEMNWVEAAKTGKPRGFQLPVCRVAHRDLPAGESREASRCADPVDGANLKVTNLPDINKYVHSEYRTGWSL